MAAVTVQILILGAATIEGALPELAQVRGDKTVAVCSSAQAGGEDVIVCLYLSLALAEEKKEAS
jgi:hypothetical protein